MNKLKRAALFDLDGVIIDSENIYSTFWAAIDQHFPTGVANFPQTIKGMNLQEILAGYFPTTEIQTEVKKMLTDFQREMQYNYFPGAMELVACLRNSGFVTCIVTSSDGQKMSELSSQHPDFVESFDVIVTGDMVSHAKPHPECYLHAARLADCPITDCIVFEDSVNGLKSGLASGAKVVGLTTTHDSSIVSPLCNLTVDSLDCLTLEMLLEL